jgi:hypothetical protein
LRLWCPLTLRHLLTVLQVVPNCACVPCLASNAPADKCAAALYAVACLKQPEAVRVLVTCVPIEPLPIGGMGQHLSLCPKSVALLVVAMPRALLSLALVGLPIRRAGVWLCLQVRLGLPGCLQQPGSLLNSIPMACGLHGAALVWPAPGVGECFGAAPVLFRLQASHADGCICCWQIMACSLVHSAACAFQGSNTAVGGGFWRPFCFLRGCVWPAT